MGLEGFLGPTPGLGTTTFAYPASSQLPFMTCGSSLFRERQMRHAVSTGDTRRHNVAKILFVGFGSWFGIITKAVSCVLAEHIACIFRGGPKYGGKFFFRKFGDRLFTQNFTPR